jgi:cobalamin biosynthesis Mg chelatase CobN
MGAVMDLARQPPLQDDRIGRALASGLALVLACAIACGGPAIARAAKATSTPALPIAATEQAPNNTTTRAGASPAATAAGAASAPTTTYAPSGGAAAPSGGPGGAPSTATTPPAAGAPATSTPVAPGAQASVPAQRSAAQTRTAKGDRPLSTGAIVIAVLAALLVLACAAWALARSSAFEPHWLLSLRHAMAEAGFRASATWSEFADWARLGR